LVFLGTRSGCAAVAVGGTATAVGVAHDRRTAGAIVDDQAIELKALDAFSRDLSFENAHINVTSYNNSVLLSGEVANPDLRRRAENMVRRLGGVERVYNYLDVGPASPLASRGSDTWITTKAKTVLLRIESLPNFDPTRVKVVTERGVVYLFGLLTEREADAVTSAVRRIDGVQKVVKLFEPQAAST
ncbi:MAG: BON domain-containing protein, partial [Acidiferrobacterales bacterium]|nr:BON domain-containing protein [Acidiferrobacterales bacterium]